MKLGLSSRDLSTTSDHLDLSAAGLADDYHDRAALPTAAF